MKSKLRVYVEDHASQILTGMGIVGLVGTTVLAVKDTPRVLDSIDDRKCELEVDKLEPLELVKTTWRLYLRSAILGVFSISCIIGAYNIHARKSAAIAAACTLSENAFRTYTAQALEVVGEAKEAEIRQAVARKRLKDDPITENTIIVNDSGETLCYDAVSGRYFKSDMQALEKAENALNRRLMNETYMSLNDYYYELGLDSVSIGDIIGWNVDDGNIDFKYGSVLDSRGRPCLFVEPSVQPEHSFRETYR